MLFFFFFSFFFCLCRRIFRLSFYPLVIKKKSLLLDKLGNCLEIKYLNTMFECILVYIISINFMV